MEEIKETKEQGYQSGHTPKWLSKRLRAYLKKKGLLNGYVPSGGLIGIAGWQPQFLGLFDHWGSFPKGMHVRAFKTQPYGNHDTEAANFAEALGVRLTVSKEGGWHHDGVFTYQFEDPDH